MENKIKMTLMFIRDYEKGLILLGRKKRGMGTGFLNGAGGHVEPGEEVMAAAIRETEEEFNVSPRLVTKIGVNHFIASHKFIAADVVSYDVPILEVTVFRADHWTGEPRESDEMIPAWYPAAMLPYGEMWEDDKFWMPNFLAGRSWFGSFIMDQSAAPFALLNHAITTGVVF